MEKRVFTWLGVFVLVGVFSMLVADRTEADPRTPEITVVGQYYSIGGVACEFEGPLCVSTDQTSLSGPLAFLDSIPDGTLSISANAGADLSGGFLHSAMAFSPLPANNIVAGGRL